MVRLPDYRDGGAVGGVQSKRRGLSQGDLDSGAIGRGASKLGNAAASIGFDMKEDESALDVLQADVERKQLMLEHQRTYENDPNHEKYGETFDVASKAIREKAASRIRSPKLREKFMLQAEGSDAGIKDGIIRKGMELKDQAREVEVEGILEQNRARFIDPKATPEQRAQARADIDAHIQLSEQSGLLKPQAAARLKQKYTKQLAIDDVETRLLVEPDKVLEDFEFLGNGGVQGSDFRGQPGPAAIRYNNPGAMWPGPSAKKFGAVEAITLNDGQGNKIAVFPDAVSGAAAQFDLLASDKYVGKTLGSMLAKWSGGNSVGAYLKVLENETGLAANQRITKEMLADPRIAIPIAKAMAVQEAGKPYPLDDTQWQSAHEMAFGAKEVQVADASGKVTPAGEDPAVAARKAELIKRYGALDPKQRLTVIKHAQTAMGVGIEDAVKKDIARVKAGLEPEPDANGELAIDRAERLIGKTAKAQELRMKFEAARAERAAIAPLDTMSEEQADAHIASLKESPWLQKAAGDAWKKKLKLRDEDPVSLVAMDETVRITNELARKRASSVGLAMDAGGNLVMEEMEGSADPEAKQAAIGSILEARIQAQRDRGMDDYQTRIITQREAKSLLQIGSPTGMDEKKYREALESAAQRAIDWYGPEYGKRALEEAIGFQRDTRTNEKKRFEDRVLRSIATGEGVTPADQRKYNELSRTTDMMSREFEMADPTAADDTRPYIGQPLQPTQQHTDWLKANISDPASIAAFDAKFGQGAAARALYAGTETKTTKDLGVAKPAAPAKSMMQSLFGG